MNEPEYVGIVHGRVLDEQRQTMVDAFVKATWIERFTAHRTNSMTWVNNVIEARADDNGDYKICGLPTRRIVTMEAADKTIIDEKTKQTRLATIRVAELDTHAEMGLAIAENRAIAWTGGR